ncbi:glycerophosphodiester phosphodiesterase [Paeniglutamicibacter antarcticus]|uniref:Glycerophosphodiester phosphodiesterase n=1 Tax=Paeniglutamicibacter antarcticus TaxID=494023 RepID=A0ABP9TNU8_9MICC
MQSQPRVGTAPFLRNTAGCPLEGFPLAFSHRGFAPDGEENTVKAFAAAHRLGFKYLETDVHASKDGVLMVYHDDDLLRLAGDRRKVSDCTWAELSELRVAGEAIPTFDQLLETFGDSHFNVDVKEPGAARLLANAINRHGARDRVLVAAFNGLRRRKFQQLLAASAPGSPIAASPGVLGVGAATLLGRIVPLPGALYRNVDALQVPEKQGAVRVVSPKFIDHAHSAGLQVHVWVINEAAQMHRLLDMGVDGIMSDRADVLAGVMDERGYWPQSGGSGTDHA